MRSLRPIVSLRYAFPTMLGSVVAWGTFISAAFAQLPLAGETLGPEAKSAESVVEIQADLAPQKVEENELKQRKMLRENDVYQALTSDGIAAATGQQVALPSVLVPGKSTRADTQMIESLAMTTSARSRFFHRSTSSPTLLSIYEARPEGARTSMYHVDIVFVAFGGLRLIQGDAFLWGMASGLLQAGSSDPEFKSRFLKSKDLSTRGIKLHGPDEHIIYNRFKIWDRLVVSTTTHVEVTKDKNTMLTAAMLDSRFEHDEEYPAQWQPIHRDSVGQLEYGEAQPYCRGGFYFQLTELQEPEGAVLVEYHQLFEEPHDWFGGANLLRSKLPLFVPVGIQYFREQLRIAERQKPGPATLFR